MFDLFAAVQTRWTSKSVNATVDGLLSIIAPGGTGYALNDTITLTGGTFVAATVVKVTGVNSGVVTAATIQTGGIYSVVPANPISQGSSSGSGTGAKFNLTYVLSGAAYTATMPATTNGPFKAEPPEGTTRPYAVIDGIGDAPHLWTNKGKYRSLVFSLTLVCDKWEDLGNYANVIVNALSFAPLTIPVIQPSPARRLVMIREGKFQYPPTTDQFHRVVLEFEATVADAVNYSPA